MQTRNRNTFTTIHTEGALLPVDLLQRIRSNDSALEGLTPESYHLAPGEKLNEAINRSWNRLNGLWGAFKAARERLGKGDLGTTLTRERWLLQIFQELGFGRLSTTKAVEIKGKSYPISHRWQTANAVVPLHLVGCGVELDKRTPGAAGAARVSPHSLLQEYLNRADDAQWGVVSNGLGLRILRDNATLTRQAYIEFDLESIFEGEIYSDFVLLWLICHQSRFENSDQQAECILERWSKSAQESGTRALDDLRAGVEEAIVSLGQGFLQHPINNELRTHLKQGDLSAQDYYRQLLRLVYRLIFLFAAEDRDLLLLPATDASVEARQRFQKYYSTTHLRALAERQRGSRHHDRYEALRLVMTLLGSDQGCPELAIPALGGFLFDARSTADLNQARLGNQALLSAVRSLAFISEGNTRRAVDYRNLGPEELGSVYESLLELHPLLNTDAGTFQLTSAAGNERKTTGSYYTPSSLIQVLLDSALDPVIEDRLKGKAGAVEQEQALLSLKVCDPACGSGHFLIAAAHRITGKLAEVRAGGNEPSPNENRRALRDVIRHCIYGVDINPMAVELCKVNLWLESIEPGKPLSFLDAHIKCGNSLVGVGPKMDLNELEIPDEAFNPVTGDHKATATLLKKRNKQERAGQESLFVTVLKAHEDLDAWLVERTRAVEIMPEDNAAEVQAKAKAYQKVNESNEFRTHRQIADLWTAAFFWKVDEPSSGYLEMVAPTQGQLWRLRNGQKVQSGLTECIGQLSREQNFFHWPLEFADAETQGGFDCVLGNPPWEMLQLEEQEFFAEKDPQISQLPGEQRKQAIVDLRNSNPALLVLFNLAKHQAESHNKFIKESARFRFTATGKMNTYALFAELARDLSDLMGQAGIIIPIGIATDDATKDFFGNVVDQGNLSGIIGFENESFIFREIHHSTKFCCFILRGSGITGQYINFVFFCRDTNQVNNKLRQFRLSQDDISRINPNTKTCPIFRTIIDAELARIIYSRTPVLENERSGDNYWKIFFKQGLFNMTSDSGWFSERKQSDYLSLYEAKMIWQFDHRYTSYEDALQANLNSGILPQTTEDQKQDPFFQPLPRYWVPEVEVERRMPDWDKNWLLGFRNVTSAIVERTAIFSVLPRVGVGHSMPLIFSKVNSSLISCLFANFCTLVFDYCVRQKLGGVNMTYGYLKQFPVLSPNQYSQQSIYFIAPKVMELTYTSWDVQSFAYDLWRDADNDLRTHFSSQKAENLTSAGSSRQSELHPLQVVKQHREDFSLTPFRWIEERRAVLRAELDAYYARLYDLNRKQLRYILDPADLTPRELEDILDPWEEVTDALDPAGYAARVAASDFPGETFRVLKEKEIKLYGEYRTRRLVLEAWDRLEGVEIGNPDGYQEQAAVVMPKQESIPLPQPKPESRPAAAESRLPTPSKPTSPVKEVEEPAAQPTLTDFGLYKCEACGKLVMGYEKANHEQEKHGGKSVEWRRMR